MTENNHFKKLVRTRMRVTGESYTKALKSFQRQPSPINTPDLSSFFNPSDLEALRKSNAGRSGLTLVAGRTAMGKTTLLNSLFFDAVRNSTQQDPQAALIENFSESAIPEEFKNIFHITLAKTSINEDKILRNLLRVVLNVVALQEIRSALPSLSHLLNAGVPVLSTIHSGIEADTSIRHLFHMHDSSYDAVGHLKTIIQVERIFSTAGSIPVASVIPIDVDARKAALDGSQNFEYHCREREISTVKSKLDTLIQEESVYLDDGRYFAVEN